MSLLVDILRKSFESDASDIHIVPGMPPLFRIHTVLEPVDGYDVITPEQSREFVLDDEMRDIITTSPVLNVLRDAARRGGARTLRQDGLAKLEQGLTTVDELMRMTEA